MKLFILTVSVLASSLAMAQGGSAQRNPSRPGASEAIHERNKRSFQMIDECMKKFGNGDNKLLTACLSRVPKIEEEFKDYTTIPNAWVTEQLRQSSSGNKPHGWHRGW